MDTARDRNVSQDLWRFCEATVDGVVNPSKSSLTSILERNYQDVGSRHGAQWVRWLVLSYVLANAGAEVRACRWHFNRM